MRMDVPRRSHVGCWPGRFDHFLYNFYAILSHRKSFQIAESKTGLISSRDNTPFPRSTQGTYFVTLKILSSRRARSTLIPKEVPGLMAAQTTSKMLPTMTCRGARSGSGALSSMCARCPLQPSALPPRQLKNTPHTELQAHRPRPCQEDTSGVTDREGKEKSHGGGSLWKCPHPSGPGQDRQPC